MDGLRIWADVSLGNIRHNYNEIRGLVGSNTLIMAVVKANGYGHGAVQVSKAMIKMGVDRFAVATINEAVKLRQAGITGPIMVLGGTSPELTELLISNNIIQAVFCLDVAKGFSQQAKLLGKVLKVHIKVDTGMSRLGFISNNPEEIKNAREVCHLEGLEVEGIFTHFTTSEEPDDPFYREQILSFNDFVVRLEDYGIKIPIKHTANSGAIINHPESYMDMVRPGIAMFGLYPGPGLEDKIALKPVMKLCATVAQIHDFEEAVSVSYNRTFTSQKPIRTATVTVGYADGLPRILSGKIDMLVHGKRAPQIGNICMDMCVIDITGIENVKVGDVVTIFGSDGENSIDVTELAQKAMTIPYEVICGLADRVERLYVD